MVSAAVRRRRAGQFWSAAAKNRWLRRGAAWVAKKICLRIPEKISFYLMMTFLVIENRNKINYPANMASAARRQIIGIFEGNLAFCNSVWRGVGVKIGQNRVTAFMDASYASANVKECEIGYIIIYFCLLNIGMSRVLVYACTWVYVQSETVWRRRFGATVWRSHFCATVWRSRFGAGQFGAGCFGATTGKQR